MNDNANREMLQALIFDVDGTIAETERDGHRVAFNRAFRECGLDWDWTVPLYGSLLQVAGGKERIKHFIEHHRPELSDSPEDFVARLHSTKTRHFHEIVRTQGIDLRPGVRRLWTEARIRSLALAIATTTTEENVDALLEPHLGSDWHNWFDAIAAGDRAPNKKPAPDVYEQVLSDLDLSPQACLAFEDSANGLASARAAGITTIVTVTDYTRHHDFGDARLVIDHLGEPGQPFTVLAGELPIDRPFFNLALARALHVA